MHRGRSLAEREDPRVGELARLYLEEAGVEVRLGSRAVRARRAGNSSTLELDDGTLVSTDVVIFATGRTPRAKDLGFEPAGVKLDARGGVKIDEQCRAGANDAPIVVKSLVITDSSYFMSLGRAFYRCVLSGTSFPSYPALRRITSGSWPSHLPGLTECFMMQVWFFGKTSAAWG